MMVPIIRKLIDNKKCFIERVLPVEGVLSVETGISVEPFDRLGECKFSQNRIVFPKGFKPSNFKTKKRFYYTGSLLGKAGKQKFIAPCDGSLEVGNDKKYIFQEAEKRYPLLAGLWGIVKSIQKNKSVLIETQTKDLLMAACTEEFVSGELVVFPNPTDILKKYYLENFAKGIKGKIIYIGDCVGTDVVKKAFEMEASAVLAGSTDVETFNFAKSNNFAFGLISGFGNIKTPDFVYKYLSAVSYRYVFFEGEKNILRVPVRPEDIKPSKEVLPLVKEVSVGMSVLVLQEPHFGLVTAVDSVSKSSIFVRFGAEKNSIEIKRPNFFLIE